MSYVQDNLMPGETVEYEARVHWIVFVPAAFVFLVALIFFAIGFSNAEASFATGIGAFFLFAAGLAALAAFVRKRSSEFAVTNRRVLIKVGLFSRHTLELLLHKVEGIGVDQPFSGRVLGFGSIVVTGTGGTRETFDRIADPLEFRRHVQNHATPAVQQLTQQSSLPPRPEGGLFCASCGAPNSQRARFCNACGQQMVVPAV